MAIYFDHRIENVIQGQHTDITWHKTAPLLAVATFTATGAGVVSIYMEEGQRVPECDLKRSKAASVIMWHPVKKVLAVGWATGEISVWNQTDKELTEAFPLHKSEITTLQWSGNGSRLISTDVDGLLIGWKADNKGNLQQNPVFQHNIEEQIMHSILKTGDIKDPLKDITTLAKAAVSGDENALDMFIWKKGQSKNKSSAATALMGPQEALSFFLGGNKGGVYFLKDDGDIKQGLKAEGPVRKLLYYEDKNRLLTVTTGMILTQHSVTPDGDMTEMLKVKLSGKADHADMVWAGKGTLATCTGEAVIRMWDIEREENFVLALDVAFGYDRLENGISVAYSDTKSILAVGTNMGNVALWKFQYTGSQEPEQNWKLQPPASLTGGISDVAWGSSRNLLAVNTIETVYILQEHTMSAHYSNQVAAVQSGPMSISVDCFNTMTHGDLKTDIQVKGVYVTKNALAVWDYKKVVVYDIANDDATKIKAAGTFATESTEICLYEQNVYTIEPGKIQVRTFQGTVKQLLSLTEIEGSPLWLDICGSYLVVATTTAWTKLYDLSRREAKLSGSKNMADVVSGLSLETGMIDQVSCNCKGTRVSITISQVNAVVDPKLYVWDTEQDSVQFFSFSTGHGEQDEFLPKAGETDTTAEEMGKKQAARDIAGRYPVNHSWDLSEPKLLVCEARIAQPEKQQHTNTNQSKNSSPEQKEVMIVTLFSTPDNGILCQDSFQLAPHHARLLGVDAPFYYFVKRSDATGSDSSMFLTSHFDDRPVTSGPATMANARVSRRVMRDFMGLENADKNSRDAMMDFSYYMTIGNMDEAFKAIKLIKSESVWENMAKMCVKNRRLDVAAVCLGNMANARGAKALREAAKEPELDAKVAVLAIQLGMLEEAERLLVQCQRYDLLNNLYQCTNRWGKALETAELYDRIHLRTTYYNHARHLEVSRDINAAIQSYEKSGNHKFEVPRMLFDDPVALEAYIMKNRDEELKHWWAQYMESTGEMDTALRHYEAAKDFLSLVRVHCYCGNFDKAVELCNETGDKAACYHLARQFETKGDNEHAVKYFTRAGAYGSALRLSKEGVHEDQLLQLALLGKKQDMLDAAKHYENQPGQQDKAVMLYHKAGLFSKALNLAFETKQFAALQVISEDLDDTTDPVTLQKCADFFVENSQFDRAVDLLAIAKRYRDALKICSEQHVPMTEELVEKLTPPQDYSQDERNRILEQVAEVCLQQRQYHLATKKFTQAGNRLKAMKVLLKSGDTEKIIFFAGVSRQREIYVMAGNYLQTLDWRKEPEIMKNIIGFYTKGKALDLLAGFYSACAQVEIDEFQNYEKAIGALNESYRCLTKAAADNLDVEDKLNDTKNRIGLIKRFIAAKRTYEESPDEGNRQLQLLLDESRIDSTVRLGHIYSFMVEQLAKKEKYRAAYTMMEDVHMRAKVNVAYFMDKGILTSIYKALNIPMTDPRASRSGGGDGRRNSPVDEEVVEEDDLSNY